MARRQAKEQARALDRLLGSEEPLDQLEQEVVVEALAEQQFQQSHTYKLIFGLGAAGLAAFFMHAAYGQHVHPWEARYTGELRSVTSPKAVAWVLLLQGASLAAAAVAMLTQLPQRAARERCCMPADLRTKLCLGASAVGAAAAAVYWGAALVSSARVYGLEHGGHPELLWLPVGPLAFVLACMAVLQGLATTGKDLLELQRLQYNFKQV
jgi:hypothetical protein